MEAAAGKLVLARNSGLSVFGWGSEGQITARERHLANQPSLGGMAKVLYL